MSALDALRAAETSLQQKLHQANANVEHLGEQYDDMRVKVQGAILRRDELRDDLYAIRRSIGFLEDPAPTSAETAFTSDPKLVAALDATADTSTATDGRPVRS